VAYHPSNVRLYRKKKNSSYGMSHLKKKGERERGCER